MFLKIIGAIVVIWIALIVVGKILHMLIPLVVLGVIAGGGYLVYKAVKGTNSNDLSKL